MTFYSELGTLRASSFYDSVDRRLRVPNSEHHWSRVAGEVSIGQSIVEGVDACLIGSKDGHRVCVDPLIIGSILD